MLTNFLSKRLTIARFKYYQNSFVREIASIAKQNSENIGEGQVALDHVDLLYKNGKYAEALKEIELIEEKYPDCTKAAKYYRGEVAYALLKKIGHLKNLTPSI